MSIYYTGFSVDNVVPGYGSGLSDELTGSFSLIPFIHRSVVSLVFFLRVVNQ